MSRTKSHNTDMPFLDLVAAFWMQLRYDLNGLGPTLGEEEDPYQELEQIQAEARSFVESENLDTWAHLSGVEPGDMREWLCT